MTWHIEPEILRWQSYQNHANKCTPNIKFVNLTVLNFFLLQLTSFKMLSSIELATFKIHVPCLEQICIIRISAWLSTCINMRHAPRSWSQNYHPNSLSGIRLCNNWSKAWTLARATSWVETGWIVSMINVNSAIEMWTFSLLTNLVVRLILHILMLCTNQWWYYICQTKLQMCSLCWSSAKMC